MMQDETVVTAVHFLRDGLPARDGNVNEVKDRLLGLCKIGNASMPVIHLRVDVDGVLALPWRIEVVIPNALKISREGFRASVSRRCREQMTSVIKHQCHKLGIRIGILLEIAQPSGCRLLTSTSRRSEVQLYTAHESTEIFDTGVSHG